MGRGHSGSTILDIVLGNNDGVDSVGEFISGISRLEYDNCSCGESILECGFWSQIKREYELNTKKDFNNDMKYFSEFFHLKNLYKIIFYSKENSEIERLIYIQNSVFRAISKVTESEVIVDSSKEITRAIFLTKYIDNSHVVHLIREPLTVFSSTYKRFLGGEHLKFLRCRFKPSKVLFVFYSILLSLSWSVGYFLSLITLLYGRSKYSQTNYDNFIDKPSEALKELELKTSVNFQNVIVKIERNEYLKIGHNIGGNRIKNNGVIKIKKSIGKTDVPFYLKVINVILTKPVWYLNRIIKAANVI